MIKKGMVFFIIIATGIFISGCTLAGTESSFIGTWTGTGFGGDVTLVYNADDTGHMSIDNLNVSNPFTAKGDSINKNITFQFTGNSLMAGGTYYYLLYDFNKSLQIIDFKTQGVVNGTYTTMVQTITLSKSF